MADDDRKAELKGQLIKVAFHSHCVWIMRGEGWRPYDEEAEIWQLGYRHDLEMWVWAGNYVQLQLALSVRTKAAGVRNPKMAVLEDQSHYFLF